MEAGREPDEAVGAVVQHATVPSHWHAAVPAGEIMMRDKATRMGAVAQRATQAVPRECDSESEQRLWASASLVITTRASFWVCRCLQVTSLG